MGICCWSVALLLVHSAGDTGSSPLKLGRPPDFLRVVVAAAAAAGGPEEAQSRMNSASLDGILRKRSLSLSLPVRFMV